MAREYVDEAESGRIADRPQFSRMLDEAGRAGRSFPGDIWSGSSVQVHPQAGARRGLQVHAPKRKGVRVVFHHRTRRRLPHRQADGGHYRERGRILLRKSCGQRFCGGCGKRPPAASGFPAAPPSATTRAHGPGRGQEASQAGGRTRTPRPSGGQAGCSRWPSSAKTLLDITKHPEPTRASPAPAARAMALRPRHLQDSHQTRSTPAHMVWGARTPRTRPRRSGWRTPSPPWFPRSQFPQACASLLRIAGAHSGLPPPPRPPVPILLSGRGEMPDLRQVPSPARSPRAASSPTTSASP